jgi:large subunit ribosomal protein L24e
MSFVRNDCKVFKFCRPKCHKAFQKKKNPRKTRWTKAFRRSAGKEMKVDATFEFEKKRNAPVRYDRDLMAATISTMKRVAEIRGNREQRYFNTRMKGNKAAIKAAHALEITKGIKLVAPSIVRATRSKAELNEVLATKVGVRSKRLAAALSGASAKAHGAMEE